MRLLKQTIIEGEGVSAMTLTNYHWTRTCFLTAVACQSHMFCGAPVAQLHNTEGEEIVCLPSNMTIDHKQRLIRKCVYKH